MSIKIEYLTLPGLENRLNEIDNEDTAKQFTAIMSLAFLMRDMPEAESEPVAILTTNTQQLPFLEDGDASPDQQVLELNPPADEADVEA